jgi:hypothetical protein
MKDIQIIYTRIGDIMEQLYLENLPEEYYYWLS